MTSFKTIFDPGFQDILGIWFIKVFDNPCLLFIIVILSSIGCILQLLKQNKFRKSKNYVYWWDIRISKKIFRIRLICLFFNMLTVILVAATIFKLILIISVVALKCDISPIFFHPDGMGGLGNIGTAALTIAFTCIIISGCGLVALIDHRGQGATHLIGDVALLLMFLFALWVLTVPLWKIDKKLDRKYSRIISETGKIAQNSFREFNQQVENKTQENVDKWLRENSEQFQILQLVMKEPRYPVDLMVILKLFVSWLAPLMVYIANLTKSQFLAKLG